MHAGARGAHDGPSWYSHGHAGLRDPRHGAPRRAPRRSVSRREAPERGLPHGDGRKWHLGFHEAAYTPLKRGFEKWYGIFPGGGSHTGHFSVSQPFRAQGGTDVTWQGFNPWDNDAPSMDNKSPTHTTHLYTAKAKEYIETFEAAAPAYAAPPRKTPRKLSSRDPWFLYLSYQAVHDPVEVGDAKYVTDTNCKALEAPRAELCGMVAEVDDGPAKAPWRPTMPGTALY